MCRWYPGRTDVWQMEVVMGRTLLRIAGLAILFAALHVPAADAQTRFSFGVGIGSPAPPVYVAPAPVYVAPYDDYYWEPAYRVWTGFEYRWVPGRWVRRGNSARWERERWRRERERERERFERDYRWR